MRTRISASSTVAAGLIGLHFVPARAARPQKNGLLPGAQLQRFVVTIPYQTIDPMIGDSVRVEVDVARSERQYWILPVFVVEEAEVIFGDLESVPLLDSSGHVSRPPLPEEQPLRVRLRVRDLFRSGPANLIRIRAVLWASVEFRAWARGGSEVTTMEPRGREMKGQVRLYVRRREDGAEVPVGRPQPFERGTGGGVGTLVFEVRPDEPAYAELLGRKNSAETHRDRTRPATGEELTVSVTAPFAVHGWERGSEYVARLTLGDPRLRGAPAASRDFREMAAALIAQALKRFVPLRGAAVPQFAGHDEWTSTVNLPVGANWEEPRVRTDLWRVHSRTIADHEKALTRFGRVVGKIAASLPWSDRWTSHTFEGHPPYAEDGDLQYTAWDQLDTDQSTVIKVTLEQPVGGWIVKIQFSVPGARDPDRWYEMPGRCFVRSALGAEGKMSGASNLSRGERLLHGTLTLVLG